MFKYFTGEFVQLCMGEEISITTEVKLPSEMIQVGLKKSI